MKARRGDLSGPVLAILVTLVLLAIGAAIIAYFVLLGGAPQHPVVAVVGQPVIMKAGESDFIAKVTIKNVGSTTLSLSSEIVILNITGTEVTAGIDPVTLAPGESLTLSFYVPDKWPAVEGRETVSGALTVGDAGTLEVVFRVIRPS